MSERKFTYLLLFNRADRNMNFEDYFSGVKIHLLNKNVLNPAKKMLIRIKNIAHVMGTYSLNPFLKIAF